MKYKNTYIISSAISMIFVILFLYAAFSKLTDYQLFKDQIAESPLPRGLKSVVATTLIVSEFIVVILLAIPRWRLKGLFVSFGLMILFTIYLILIMNINKDFPCSCGGLIELLSPTQHVFFNSTFIGIAALGIMHERQRRKQAKLMLASINNVSYVI